MDSKDTTKQEQDAVRSSSKPQNVPQALGVGNQGTQSNNAERMRTDSESSTEGPMRFMLPSLDGSPPKIVTLEEVSSMFKNLQNMELAHEIALNPDFKLQPYEPPKDSMEGRIKSMVHKAFWDILREQLERTTPCFDQAIHLLTEIKELFPQILTSNNARALAHINEVLDESVIRQQAQRGLLDFKSYANFVINVLARMCSQERDEAVANLNEIDDVVDTFRGILEVMTLMKLDMANFWLTLARKDIAANSVEYEKEKFSRILQGLEKAAGFPATEDWLRRNRTSGNNDETIYNAYMELMDWPAGKEFPEMLQIDQNRFAAQSLRAQRVILCSSLMSIAQSVPVISQRRENRTKLAQQLHIIMQDLKQEDQVSTSLESCFEQIRVFINEALAREELAGMDETIEMQLKNQVLQLSNKSSPVRSLLTKRLDGFVRASLRSNGSISAPPAGFADYQEELIAFIASFRRLVSYNHAVFGEYFTQLLIKQEATSGENAAATAAAVTAQLDKP